MRYISKKLFLKFLVSLFLKKLTEFKVQGSITDRSLITITLNFRSLITAKNVLWSHASRNFTTFLISIFYKQ